MSSTATNSGVKIYSFGMVMPGRSYSANSGYRFGFNGKLRDDEIKGDGNSLDFGARDYDPRLGRWWSIDKMSIMLTAWSPYTFSLNNPIILIDPDGRFPILVNGHVSSNSERASPTYWGTQTISTISRQTGYKQSDFRFVDGDHGFWPGSRKNVGIAQGKLDAQAVYAKLKETMKDGQITEQLQFITHSRGAAFGVGYMQGLSAEVIKLAEKDGVGFAYGKNNLIEYSVNLAPHQSWGLNYPNNGSNNVNISHVGDPLSGGDATGNVINVVSIPEKESGPLAQHSLATFDTELNTVLHILGNNTDKSKVTEQFKAAYKQYDNNRNNGDQSKVTPGSN